MTQTPADAATAVELPPTHELVPLVQQSAKERGFDLGIEAARQLVEFFAVVFDAVQLHRGRATSRQALADEPADSVPAGRDR